jgi:rSAM/selenodomain-associated transferase 2
MALHREGVRLNLSIIIPTFNEADSIHEQVRRCLALSPSPEVIVVDGDSEDGTPRLAHRAGALTLSCSGRGRAHQMNAGASKAGGNVLLFLHADVTLPQRAHAALLKALLDPDLIGGAFRRRFDTPSRLLELGCRLADFRGVAFGVYLGDQGIFVRRDSFLRMGGFPEIHLFEDFALSRRMRRFGTTRLLHETVLASGRRFRREGSLRRTSRNVWLTLRYLTGADPESLARRYYPGYFERPSEISPESLSHGGMKRGRS